MSVVLDENPAFNTLVRRESASPFQGRVLESGEHTTGIISYLKPQRERPYNYMFEPPEGEAWQNCEYVHHQLSILDARTSNSSFRLSDAGFELLDAPTKVLDFAEESVVTTLYYDELRALALAVTGGNEAYVFDHLIRNREAGRPLLGFGRQGDGSRPAAVGRAHNDYTEDSGRRRLGLVLNGRRPVESVPRFCILNIWRPLNGPVLDTPLAVCDARTVAARDLVASDVYYPSRKGEVYLVHHSEHHQWRYFSEMRNSEVLLFKQYDSQLSGVARYTPHAAFDHPDMPPSAPLRRSIEARCLVVFD